SLSDIKWNCSHVLLGSVGEIQTRYFQQQTHVALVFEPLERPPNTCQCAPSIGVVTIDKYEVEAACRREATRRPDVECHLAVFNLFLRVERVQRGEREDDSGARDVEAQGSLWGAANPFVQYIEVRYIEQAASILAWTCETYSPPTCAACAMRGDFRRTTSPM